MQNCSRNRCSNYNNMDEIKYFYNNRSPSIYSRKVGIKMARKSENQKCNSKSSRQNSSSKRTRNTKSNSK